MNSLLFTSLILLTSSSISLYSSNSGEASSIIIKKTIEEDLLSMNIDYEKYCIDVNRVVNPILIAFTESQNTDYKSLLYFYDPLNQINDKSVLSFSLATGDDMQNLSPVGIKAEDKKLHYVDSSKDEKIDRYYIDYVVDINKKYSDYKIHAVDSFTLDSHYVFNHDSLSLDYSNCLNVQLGDPHCWSWHFDEDTNEENLFESFCKWFGYNTDTLKDQIFYSFYVKNWEIKNIKSIDFKYKKVLLDGYRYNEADLGADSTFYRGSDNTYKPKFYKWNDENNETKQDRSVLLGNSLEEISSKVDYTKRKVTSAVKTSVGAGHNYSWNTIQDKKNFEMAFGSNSDITKFANNYFNEDENYWVINFDSFIYNFMKHQFKVAEDQQVIDDKIHFIADKEHPDFQSYLINNGTYYPYGNIPQAGYFNYYNFTQEYVFDVVATEMTFEDASSVEYSLPVSVQSVDEEASGGESTPGDLKALFDKFLDSLGPLGVALRWLAEHWKLCVAILLGLIALKLLFSIFGLFKKK